MPRVGGCDWGQLSRRVAPVPLGCPDCSASPGSTAGSWPGDREARAGRQGSGSRQHPTLTQGPAARLAVSSALLTPSCAAPGVCPACLPPQGAPRPALGWTRFGLSALALGLPGRSLEHMMTAGQVVLGPVCCLPHLCPQPCLWRTSV